MRKSKSLFGFVFVLLCATFFITSGPASAADKPIKLKFAAFFPATSDTGKAVEKILSLVEERSNGRVKFEKYYLSTLIGQDKMLDGLARDVADVTYVATPSAPSAVPLTQAAAVFGIGYNSWAGMMAFRDFAQVEPIAKEWARNNALPAWSVCFFPSTLISTKPVKKIDDFKGLRIFGVGGQIHKIIKDLGAIPVSMTATEIYDSVSKKTLDSILFSVEYYQQWRFAEVCKYWMPDTNMGGVYYTMAWNIKTFNKLPKDIQKIIMDMRDSGETIDIFYKICHLDQLTPLFKDVFPKQGIEIVRWGQEDIAKLRNITASNIDKWVDEQKAQGHKNMNEILGIWRDLYKKYEAMYPEHAKKMDWKEPTP